MFNPDTTDHIEPDNTPLQPTTVNQQDKPVQPVKPGNKWLSVLCFINTISNNGCNFMCPTL